MTNNPIPELLALVPEELTILDYKLLDKFRATIKEKTHLIVNNSYIIALLEHLRDNGVVSMYNISSDEDKFIYLIINEYGRKDLS